MAWFHVTLSLRDAPSSSSSSVESFFSHPFRTRATARTDVTLLSRWLKPRPRALSCFQNYDGDLLRVQPADPEPSGRADMAGRQRLGRPRARAGGGVHSEATIGYDALSSRIYTRGVLFARESTLWEYGVAFARESAVNLSSSRIVIGLCMSDSREVLKSIKSGGGLIAQRIFSASPLIECVKKINTKQRVYNVHIYISKRYNSKERFVVNKAKKDRK